MRKHGLILVCLAISCSTLFAADKVTNTNLVSAARKAYDAISAEFQAGSCEADEVYDWSKRLLTLQLKDSRLSKEQRLGFYAEHHDRMKKLYKEHLGSFRGTDGTTRSPATSEFYMQEAQFMLEEQRDAK